MPPAPENRFGTDRHDDSTHPRGEPATLSPGELTPAAPPFPEEQYTPRTHDLEATLPGPVGALPCRFGNYTLIERIARGGMGEVYRAQELGPDTRAPRKLVPVRMVALKQILRGRVDTPGAVERFQRETLAAKKFDHPGIVPIYESGVIDGDHYFTMPFVPGGNLQQHVGNDPLSPRQAARIIRQVADAVQYAHDHGVIHRDIKPQNILLQPHTHSSPDENPESSHLALTPRLTDFGLARLITDESGLSLSQKGEAMGTPGYMPPEQARGNLDAIGPASDVYGLGAVLYALLTGRPPFPLQPPSSILETLEQVTREDPIPVSRLVSTIPPELEDVCTKCLDKEPANRYPSAAKLAEALDDFLEGKPALRHTPRRAGWLRRTQRRLFRSIQKHPGRSAYVAFSILTVIILGWLHQAHLAQSRREAAKLREEAEAEVRLATAHVQRGERRLALEQFAVAREKYLDLIRSAGEKERQRFRLVLASIRIERASILRRDPRTRAQARKEFEEARSELEKLGVNSPDDPQRRRLLAEAFHGLGVVCSAERTIPQLTEALEFYRQTLPLRLQLCEKDPDNRDYLRDLARSYGFMGDTELDLGDEDDAKKSYDEAARIRDRIIRLVPRERVEERLDALCQRARDFGNEGNYQEHRGKPDLAFQAYHSRDEYYRRTPELARAARLHGEFWIDRAENRLTMADLQLDLQGSTREALDWTKEARDEYQDLARGIGGGKLNREIETGLARSLVIQGKALALAGDPIRPRATLTTALEQLERITSDGVPQSDDLYLLAVTHAWLGRLAGPGMDTGENALAMAKLREAVTRDFTHLPRLRRERGFERIRQAPETRESFSRLVERIQQGAGK